MLKIGQEVKVRYDLAVDQFYGGCRFHNGMSKYKGKLCKIANVRHYDNSRYNISIDSEGYDFTEAMFIS